MTEQHKTKDIRIRQQNYYSDTSYEFFYIDHETDEAYQMRMQKAYDAYVKKNQSNKQVLEDKIKSLEEKIVNLKAQLPNE